MRRPKIQLKLECVKCNKERMFDIEYPEGWKSIMMTGTGVCPDCNGNKDKQIEMKVKL